MAAAAAALMVAAMPALSEPPDGPAITIIIDDLGNALRAGERTAALPGPVACAVLPHTPHAARLARACHGAGKEVMLHLPMQPGSPTARPGPGVITATHGRDAMLTTLQGNLASVPHVVGINNHMGSRLTRDITSMHWLMEELGRQDQYFFVDSFTSISSVAMDLADRHGVPAVRRDVFLDPGHAPTEAVVRRQVERLRDTARRRGYAVGIGHPWGQTLSVLEEAIPALEAEGFTIVGVADNIYRDQPRDEATGEASWPASWFRWPTASRK